MFRVKKDADLESSEFALHGFAVDSVAFVASFVADVLAWLVTQVGGHFSLEGSFEDGFAAQARKVLVEGPRRQIV